MSNDIIAFGKIIQNDIPFRMIGNMIEKKVSKKMIATTATIVIIVIIIILLTVFAFLYKFISKNHDDDDSIYLVHCSVEQTYPTNILLDALVKFKKDPLVTTINQTVTEFSTEALRGFSNNIAEQRTTNYFDGILNGVANQFKGNGGNVHRSDIWHAAYASGYVKSGKHGDFLSFLPLKSIKTGKLINSYMYTQTFGGYENDNAYKSAYNVFTIVREQYEKDKIPFTIMGDFNVAGWGKVSDHVFGDTVYHNDGLFITCNDNEGIATPDGIIVHKNICNGVKYGILEQHVKNRQHYAIYAMLTSSNTGIQIDENTKCLNDWLLKNYTGQSNYFNFSKFDPSNHVVSYELEEFDISDVNPMSSFDVYEKVINFNEAGAGGK